MVKRTVPTASDFLSAKLRSSLDIAEYVGSGDDARITLGKPIEPQCPYIAFEKFAGESLVSHDGISGLGSPIYQIWVVDKQAETVDNLSELVRLAIQGFAGTAGGVNVSNVHKLPVEEDIFDEDSKEYVRRLLFRIWFQEAKI